MVIGMSSTQYANLATPEPRPSGQVTVMPSAPTVKKRREKYKQFMYNLGIGEIVFGIVSFILWLATIITAYTTPPHCYDDYIGKTYCHEVNFGSTYISAGLWCGIFLFVSGGLGIATKKNSNVAIYNANLVMAIITSVMMGVQIIISGIASGTSYEYYSSRVKILHAMLAFVGLAGMLLCIAHAAFCCAASCRKKRNYGTVVYSTRQTVMPQQYIQLGNGQLALIQSQPMLPQGYPMMMMSAGPSIPMSQVPGAPIMPVTTFPGQPTVQPALMKPQVHGNQFYPGSPPSYDSHNS